MKEQDTNSPIIHLQRQQLLLRMEYEYEKEEFKRQTENMGVARKVKRGLCWYPATPGRSYYNSLNQLVIEITHTENTDIEHNFEFGRPVCFFRQSADGKITYMNFTATVSYADETRMVAIMPGAGAVMEVQETDNLGVQLYFDETSYRTMFEALEDTLRSKGNRLAELRDILLGTSKAGFRELYPVRFPWLNSTQETAVNKVLCARDVAIVHGPPGTGKTLMAKAMAGEANVPFFSMSGSDFVEMFVGVGASRVRDLFKQAKEKAPCIIFIDEIDAIGRARGKNPNMGSNDERENTLNQLLTEMDGFGTNSGIIVLAATNRVDILDKALLRAGRFDRQIYVDLPDLNDRKEIFMVHLRDVKIAPDVDVDLLSRQTPGFSGADIANVCNEAALIAARRSKEFVEKQDFMDAVDRIVGGLEKRSKITTEEERESIATHEAGHATISWHLKYANPLIKVTIVPRGKALGAAWYLPEERQITPEQALLDEICSLLGGRAAEDLFLGCVSTGALNDLERASKQAYAIVAYYGMSKSLPNVSYYDSTGQDYMFAKPYSEDRARMIDAEVTRVLSEQYERAKQILKEYEGGHHQLRDLLLTREVIFTEDVEHIFGKRKWASRADEIIKANEEKERQRSIAAGDADKSETDSLSDPDDSATPPPVPEEEK